MKKMIMIAVLFLTPLAAFAQPVQLKPGSSIVINGDVISCLGPAEDQRPPACSIRQDGSYYRLLVGAVVAESFYTFNQALEGAKAMKNAGLCR